MPRGVALAKAVSRAGFRAEVYRFPVRPPGEHKYRRGCAARRGAAGRTGRRNELPWWNVKFRGKTRFQTARESFRDIRSPRRDLILKYSAVPFSETRIWRSDCLPSVAIDLKVNGWNARGEPWKFAVIVFLLASSPLLRSRVKRFHLFFPFFFIAAPESGRLARDVKRSTRLRSSYIYKLTALVIAKWLLNRAPYPACIYLRSNTYLRLNSFAKRF